MSGPTREEFKAFSERVYQQVDAGFSGVHERLDVLNGRTGKGEVAVAELRARVLSVEKEVFQQPRRRAADDDPRMAVTKKDLVYGGVGLMILAASIKFVLFLGEIGIELLKATVKHP